MKVLALLAALSLPACDDDSEYRHQFPRIQEASEIPEVLLALNEEVCERVERRYSNTGEEFVLCMDL